jgi:D-arabinose 1-dehydrogenase-like Zn-dependent alcohol dehydrogenase
MCSSATSLHALRRARLQPGDAVAVFGAGGLGMSAIQLAAAMGAGTVYAIDIDRSKLRMAEALGAVAIDADASSGLNLAAEGGVDVALDLVGLPQTMRGAIEAVGIGGRAVSVGISDRPIEIVPFLDLAMREATVTGVADHHLDDIVRLLDFAMAGALDLTGVVTEIVDLDAIEINDVMDRLEDHRGPIRAVIVPR